MVAPAAKRKAVVYLMNQHGMSERRECRAIGYWRMTIRYETRRSDDQGLRERMKALAHERRRFGYRRLALAPLERKGDTVLITAYPNPFREVPHGHHGALD